VSEYKDLESNIPPKGVQIEVIGHNGEVAIGELHSTGNWVVYKKPIPSVEFIMNPKKWRIK